MSAHLFRIVGVLALIMSATFSWGADNSQHKTASGIDVYFGVVPAEVVQVNVKQHGAESMHGKTRLARGTHHLVVTLYDAKTSEPIPGATVSATVTQLGLSQETKDLEVMKINNTISYGNYFNMPPDDTPYRIVLAIRRPTDHAPVPVEFEYWHGVNR